MGLTKKITNRGKKMVFNPTVMRWISDDRVMKAAEGMLGARTRVRAAWKVLLDGHSLPVVDRALDDSIGEPESRVNGKSNGNGHAAPASVKALKKNGNGHSNGNGHGNGAHSFVQPGSDNAVLDQALRERTSLAGIGGKDVFEKAFQFMAADNARKIGMYPFFRPLDMNDGPEAVLDGRRVVM